MSLRSKLEWVEQKVSAGMAPWMARTGRWLTLFVQPWYGDGIKYRGIIQHHDWTLTLKEQFSDKKAAMFAVEKVANNLDSLL